MPSRQFQQRRTPSIVVIVLLLLALIVGAFLLSAGNDSKQSSSTTVAPSTPGAPGSVAVVASGGPASITAVSSFDPGDSQTGNENPDQTSFVLDNDPATAWTTSCYNDPYFNGKPGVGLVVSLSGAATGTLSIDVANAPYQLRVYASSAETPPATVDGWGSPVQPKSAGTTAGIVTATVSGPPARFLLVLLLEAAKDNGCSAKFPYRGSISGISFASA